MRQRLQQRLQFLRSEFETGQKMAAELEAKQANLRETLLRINGAIQVLEELLSETPEEAEESVPLSDFSSNSRSGSINPSNLSEPLPL